MGIIKQVIYKVDNGTDYDIYHYETETGQVKTTNGSTVDVELELAKQHSLYRQALINGNFDVWQRGTTFTQNVGAGGSTLYTADRWFVSTDSTSNITYSKQQFTNGQTSVPNNPKNYFRTVVASQSGATWLTINQAIEGVDKFAGMNVTVSFWAKSDANRTLQATFKQRFGTGGSPSSDVQLTTQNVSLTTSWQKFSLTFSVPSISGKTLGVNGDDYLALWFGLPVNTVQTTDIAQVQINAGNLALPFQPKSLEEELRACKRYYQRFSYLAVAVSTTTIVLKQKTFPISMRTTPTVTLGSDEWGTNGDGKVYNYTTATLISGSWTTSQLTKDGLVGLVNSGLTVGNICGAGMSLDAEL